MAKRTKKKRPYNDLQNTTQNSTKTGDVIYTLKVHEDIATCLYQNNTHKSTNMMFYIITLTDMILL